MRSGEHEYREQEQEQEQEREWGAGSRSVRSSAMRARNRGYYYVSSCALSGRASSTTDASWTTDKLLAVTRTALSCWVERSKPRKSSWLDDITETK